MGPNPLDDLLFGPQDPCGTFVDEGEGTIVSMGACGGDPAGVQRSIKDVINAALKTPRLGECLNKIFGRGQILTNNNLPRIDTTVSKAEISRVTGVSSDATIQVPVPASGSGTILMATEMFYGPDSSSRYVQAVYIHEKGNILAAQLLGGWNARPDNDPTLRNWDRDTGMNLEDCVFGGAVQHDGSVTRSPH